jgi:glycosyltransferase 2 family protein
LEKRSLFTKHKLIRLAKAASKPLLGLAMLAFLLKSGFLRLEELRSSLTNFNILFFGILLLTLQTLFFSFRWKYFVNQVVPFSLFQSIRQTLIGYFFNFFIPGGVGGDVIKALDLSKTKGLPKSRSFSLIILDRILGLYAMIIFSMIFLFLEDASAEYDLKRYLKIATTMFLLSTVGLFFSTKIVQFLKLMLRRFNPEVLIYKVIHQLSAFCERISLSVNLKNISWSLVFSFFAQLFAIIFLYKVAAEQAPSQIQYVPFMLFFPLACFAFMASSIPITPGGIGLGQASFYYIFAQFNKNIAEQLVIGISIYQLFCLAAGFLGGFFYLTSNRYVSIPETYSKTSEKELHSSTT